MKKQPPPSAPEKNIKIGGKKIARIIYGVANKRLSKIMSCKINQLLQPNKGRA